MKTKELDFIFPENIDEIRNKHNSLPVEVQFLMDNGLYIEYAKKADKQKMDFDKLLNHALRVYLNMKG